LPQSGGERRQHIGRCQCRVITLIDRRPGIDGDIEVGYAGLRQVQARGDVLLVAVRGDRDRHPYLQRGGQQQLIRARQDAAGDGNRPGKGEPDGHQIVGIGAQGDPRRDQDETARKPDRHAGNGHDIRQRKRKWRQHGRMIGADQQIDRCLGEARSKSETRVTRHAD
jgi:hypothetical protein